MINPFKKRQQRKAAAAAHAYPSTPPPTDYSSFPSTSKLPPRPGIFISSAPAASRTSYHERQKQATAAAAAASQQKSLDHVLPPASDYRQSLIMPHLTRRFTLLRAPDGSLVSPDAMRAHLRAQRARARAANIAIGSGMANHVHFLTEDEENEIIEQLKAQARAEGRDFDLEQSATAAAVDSWRNGYAAGTDGFGSWGPTPTTNANKLSSLAETLGDLSSSHGHASSDAISSAWSPTKRSGGSLFTGRSAERDQAYFRKAKSERKNSKTDDTRPSHKSDPALESSQEATPEASTTDSQPLSNDSTFRLASSHVQEPPMPGGFVAAEDTEIDRPSSVMQQDHQKANTTTLLDVPGLNNASHSRSSQDSNLLTTLSPEAFKRVSTALDEVFGLIASERGPSPGKVGGRSFTDNNHKAQRSSVDSDANSFASALSQVRASDARQADSENAASSAEAQGSGAEDGEEDGSNETADLTITGPQPTLDAVHIEEGRLALLSPDTLPGSLPGAHPDFVPELPQSQTATHLPSLVTSDSALTVRDGRNGAEASASASSSLLEVAPFQHLSVSGHSLAESTHTRPSDRSSTATATEVPPQASRIVSTASTIEGHELDQAELTANADAPMTGTDAFNSAANQRSHDQPPPSSVFADSQNPPPRPDRTSDMYTSAHFASPAQSTLSRGDSIVSAGSLRSSLTGPSAAYQGTHSRKSSADKLALARSIAPHPHLREQPSLSSVRRNYRQHVRSTTGSSEGSLLGGLASRRSSGAMSPPPVLSRSVRSPSYFPPPSSNASMYDYASGFKPPSAISPAAAAALHSMANQPSPQPMQTSVMDASNALRSVQSMRNSASTNQSVASPQVPSFAAFTSGSDRAAATSSPETGTTSLSLHQRNASLTNAKQLPQMQSSRVSSAEDGFSPSMYAPRPAPVPGVVASQPSQTVSAQPVIKENGLMPNPPSDPEQAERWRAVYGIKATDATSLRASAEDVSADPNEDEDLWARMASASEPHSERPVSNFPPSIAEQRLAGTGITFDQIADFQDRLIQTANGGEVIPPLPRIEADDNLQQRKFVEAKSKGLASPNVVVGTGSEWSKPAPSVQTGEGLAFAGGSTGKSINANHDAPLHRSPSSNISHDPPLSPRAVMYDVTTSHRPTSPPLHSRNGSLNGLPSLLELNGSSIGHRNHESFSLSQAIDQASRIPRQPPFRPSSIAEDPNSPADQDQFAIANPVQEHPFNVGYTSPSLRSGNGFTFPRRTSEHDIGHSPRSPVQNLPEDVWNRYGPQQGAMTPDLFATASPGSPLAYPGSDPTRLLDDIAAQTSAATRALKGTDDGSVPTPPFRTKSISRKKSFKKVSKQISSPQLISTTQKLDHATQIPNSLDTPAPAKGSKRSIRSPGWGSIGNMGIDSVRGHSKASPSGASQSGSVSKSSGYFHRRRSSSFGHEASPDESFGVDATSVATEQGNGSGDRTHPNHPYMNGGANGGSLSRLFSKIKRGKSADQGFGGATIEPFPAELSANARGAAESISQQQQQHPYQPQQQQFSQPPPPMSPQTPVLPQVERSTPWTLPRMPSTVSGDRESSIRSPASPVYTLPIDSTSLPRNKGKKKRTPIVLKRESEVIMPGDPGYIPTAIIGRSPEERAAQEQGSGLVTVADADELVVPQEVSTDTTLEHHAERMDYSWDEGATLAPVAAVAVAEEDDESVTPRPASLPPAEAESGEEGDLTLGGADSTLPADVAAATLAESPLAAAAALAEPTLNNSSTRTSLSTKANARKSLRDTIVRRTIIIPAGIDFSDPHRRSLFASSRKSRRFAAAEDEPIPTPTSSHDPPAAADNASLPSDKTNGTTEAEGEREGEGMMSTLSSRQTLHPDTVGDKSNRASRVESSYAGSLYDMYIGTTGEGIEFGSPSSDARKSVLPNTRAEPRRHIEVTERADGSVVWQVIAGLADRESVYSDFNPRHTRTFSESSNPAFAEGEEEDGHGSGGLFRTPAGLTDDDSRSFFTRPSNGGAHRKSFSFDKGELPLPDLPSSLARAHAQNGVQQDVFELANPPPAHGSELHDESLDRNDATDKMASPTRIVYHNDAQLASLLNVLARGKDSAKFEFQIAPPAHSLDASLAPNHGALSSGVGENENEAAAGVGMAGEGRPLSSWSKEMVLDADDIESHRSRVEAEIYTLLNQQALLGRGVNTTAATVGEGEAYT
ncbi:uncharacterized protein UTRI_10642_B [Ustilago trichophora]|uniref:Uncharacterized protein n=1 Tax=Ustilago trichophora TaxID=86804 RepID=A0A5C3EAK0_9BASI|nr:uncharacterized protein UTRI_10642_B [Ustilago trichophora]